MLRNFAWKAFERTGNINAYIMFREADEINNEGDDSYTDIAENIAENIAKDIVREIVKEGEEMVVSS